MKSAQKHVRLPQRIQEQVLFIWRAQSLFANPTARGVRSLMRSPKFRLALDCFMLKAQSDASLNQVAIWWESYLAAEGKQRPQLLSEWLEQ